MSIKLSWETAAHPERSSWSNELLKQVGLHQAQLEQGNPNAFIAGYDGLSAESKTKFWGELIVAMAKYESSWNPADVYHEPPPLNVDSVGLLQLSVQDGGNYHLTPPVVGEDKLKDPAINLEWAVQILARLLSRDKVVASSANGKYRGGAGYWSVLRAGHKVDQIISLVRQNVPV
ncbi:MAG TPA: transglycosylase SLT domain-containing protein [Chthoniobacter sp.]|jgi:soluble lytic murein transglycosylase-like protein